MRNSHCHVLFESKKETLSPINILFIHKELNLPSRVIDLISAKTLIIEASIECIYEEVSRFVAITEPIREHSIQKLFSTKTSCLN